jgi:hypothetical protein
LPMTGQPRYTIKKYIFLIVLSMTIAFIIVLTTFSLLGIPCQGLLIFVVLWFPIGIFLALYGFYKGLVKFYDLKKKGETEED